MTSTELDILAPLDTPLPPPPQGEVLTEVQWCTLMAIADAIIPAFTVSTAPSNSYDQLSIQASEYAKAVQQIEKSIPSASKGKVAQRYLQENASSTPGFKDSIHRQLGHYVREDAIKGIRVVLSALE